MGMGLVEVERGWRGEGIDSPERLSHCRLASAGRGSVPIASDADELFSERN
jgi:hypothetical protein